MKHAKFILPVLLVLFISVAGWKYYEQREIAKAEQAEKYAQEQQFREDFENFLNDFLQETAEGAREYRKQRKIVMELVKPENLIAAEYIQDNYELMQNLVPELEDQMNQIMSHFEEADQNVKALLEGRSAEDVQLISNKWEAVKTEQAEIYLTFFSFEQQVLSAHQELMSVYHDIQGRISYDLEGQQIVYENSQDELNVQAKRKVIKTLLRSQAQALDEKQDEQ